MTSYVTADEQRKIRSELEQVQHIMQTILERLNPPDRTDERVTRIEATLAAIERALWTMTAGPGRLGPAVRIRPILRIPASFSPVPKGGQSA